MTEENVEENRTSVVVRLHAQPKASKTEFAGLHGNRIKVRIQAPPVEGAANKSLTRFIARQAGVAPACVEMIRGATGRRKDITIDCGAAGANVAEVANRIRQAAFPGGKRH